MTCPKSNFLLPFPQYVYSPRFVFRLTLSSTKNMYLNVTRGDANQGRFQTTIILLFSPLHSHFCPTKRMSTVGKRLFSGASHHTAMTAISGKKSEITILLRKPDSRLVSLFVCFCEWPGGGISYPNGEVFDYYLIVSLQRNVERLSVSMTSPRT